MHTDRVSVAPDEPRVAVPSSRRPLRRVVPINSLDFDSNPKWRIRAHVVVCCMKEHRNSSGWSGKLLNLRFADESGEIRAVAFGDAAERLFPLIKKNKVYIVSGARIQYAHKQYLHRFDYELSLGKNTIIKEDTSSMNDDQLQLSFDFTPFSQIFRLHRNCVVDVIGICAAVRNVTTTNNEVSKRRVKLVDQLGHHVFVTLWGEQAENFDASNQVVAIKSASVDENNCLSVIAMSSIIIDPDCPETSDLYSWFESENKGHVDTMPSSKQLGLARKVLNDLRVFLTEYLKPEEIIDHLKQCRMVGTYAGQQLDLPTNVPMAKNRIIIDEVSKGGPGTLEKFCTILRCSGSGHTADEIEKRM